jgi:hypothetical protein
MRRCLRRLALVALSLALLPLGGCTVALCTISIPDFGTKAVGGVWLWKLSAATGVYERDTLFLFGAMGRSDGAELLNYQAAPADGSTPLATTATLFREASNPDHVTLQLMFSRKDAAGYYRASTYNASGDSPLSTEILPF